MSKELIKDFYGKVLGSIEDRGGTIIAKDFYGAVVGTYDKNKNITKDFYGRIVCKDDGTVSLIMAANH